ncbi:MAG: DUF362 domain-containing protein [Candidatus Hodarchaeota archaeon]
MKATIYFSKSEKRKEFTLKILDLFKNQIEGTVFIKPNQVSFEDYPTTTHPDILETVITFLQDNGHELICGDGQGIDVRSKKVEITTITQLCKKHGVQFKNLFKEPMKNFKSPRGFKVKMSTLPFKADSIISLPILKYHPHFRMTGALKMVVGYLSKFERIKMHMKIVKNPWKIMAEANWLLMNKDKTRLHLIIMDAVQTMIRANEFRHGGEAVDLGYLLASNSPPVLDIYGFSLLKDIESKYKNKDISYIPYIKFATEYGLGGPEYELKEINF